MLDTAAMSNTTAAAAVIAEAIQWFVSTASTVLTSKYAPPKPAITTVDASNRL